MTFPDRTCYPVASCNLKDFYNLIDVGNHRGEDSTPRLRDFDQFSLGAEMVSLNTLE